MKKLTLIALSLLLALARFAAWRKTPISKPFPSVIFP